ncbi:hypothetical protein BC826DRAFT_1055789 [Russula brevipes]|nr:hypothetical protein BC826DRAFT_1055789 [Russula brevipes]
MAGRKHRGSSRGRGHRGRGIDRGRGWGGGRGRGRGRGPSHVAGSGKYDDFASDTTFSHSDPRGWHYASQEHGEKVTGLDGYHGLDNTSRYQSPLPRTVFSNGNGFRYGRGRYNKYIGPDSSGERDRAGMGYSRPKVSQEKTPLSQLLFESRPLLKPIKFVRSENTPTLFLDEEEILKPAAEETDEQAGSHVRTAEQRIFQIFHRDDVRPNSPGSPSGVEDLPEIDFADLGRIMNEIEGLSTSAQKSESHATATTPSPLQASPPTNSIPVDRHGTRVLGDDTDDDEEIIVYVAPNPRNGRLAPNVGHAPVSTRVQQGTRGPLQQITERVKAPSPSPTPSPSPQFKNAISSGSSRPSHPVRRTQRPSILRRRMKRRAKFGSFGAIRAEEALYEVGWRRNEARRGDSDIDWGGSTSEESVEDGGMLEDQDIDIYSMQTFVKGMSIAGTVHVHADNWEDEGKSDEESEAEGDSSAADDDGTWSWQEETPTQSFQARLERLRKRMEGRSMKDVLEDELDQAPEADELESVIADIQDLLDDDEMIDYAGSPARRRKDKFVPKELRDQWDRDRAKKAERKRLPRMAAASAAPVSLETIVESMRRFVADKDGAQTLPLPPMGREMRKYVHELAHAFKLKSKSQGQGDTRSTTLMKKSFDNSEKVNEKAVLRILRKSPWSSSHVTRPRDGEVVGEVTLWFSMTI